MQNMTVPVELYVDLSVEKNEPTINASFFLNDQAEPSVEVNQSFAKLLDQYIEANSIPSSASNDYFTNDKYRQILLKDLSLLQNIISEKIKKVQNIPDIKNKDKKPPAKNKKLK